MIASGFPRRDGSHLFRSEIVGWLLRAMAHGMNDDLIVLDFIEDQIRIGRRRDAPNAGFIGGGSRPRIEHQQLSNVAKACMNTSRALRGALRDVVEN